MQDGVRFGSGVYPIYYKFYFWKMGFSIHCTKNPIYVFPEMKLRGLFPNSCNHVSVSHLNIHRISLPIWLQR
jgi:hypothetical protein